MLNVMACITTDKEVAENQERGNEFGLVEPLLKVEATLNNDVVVSFNIGSNVAISTGGYYATVLGNKGIYVVEDTLYSAFQFSEKELVEESSNE